MRLAADVRMLPAIRQPLAVLVTALALMLAACGAPPTEDPTQSPSGECVVPVDGVVHITADNLEFSHDCIRVPFIAGWTRQSK
jgi:hypothetical protein